MRIKNVRDDIKIMNQTNNRQSFDELDESCSYNEDNEALDYDEFLIPKADWKNMDDENPRCPAPTLQDHDADNHDGEEPVKHQMVMQYQINVFKPGPLISGRLDLRVIEGARMLLSQFYGAVNEETAVNGNDLYICLYDRDINKEEDRRSTLINFKQLMLDVEYIRHVIGPSNEIKIWTLIIGTPTQWFRF